MKKSQFYQLSSQKIAIILVILSSFCFSLLNVVSKLLYTHGMANMQIVFFRSLSVLLLWCVPMIVMMKKSNGIIKYTRKNVIKGVVDFVSTPIWILAIAHIPMSEAVSITYLTPIITVALAIIFLKDTLTKAKVLAIIVSFIGVIIISNPSFSNYNYYSLYALAACILWAIANILTKNLVSISQHPVQIIYLSNIIILLLSAPFFLASPCAIDWHQIGLFAMIGISSSGGYIFLAYAYKMTSVNNLAPFDYFRMIFSSIMGYIFFNQIISINTIIGSVIIFSSSLFLIMHLSKAEKKGVV